VFGDDRVRGTREQMILQVDLVRLRVGARLACDKDFIQSFYYVLEQLKYFILLNLVFVMDFMFEL